VSSTATAVELPWQELHANLRAFVGRRVRNQADVDDLVQRVLLQIVTGLRSLRDMDRLHAWVYRVARNVIVDYYRSPAIRRERPSGDTVDLASAKESAESILREDDERAARRELATCLLPMMRQLSPTYQDALRMADLEGVTQAEAARRAGVSVSGMKSRVQRARQQLRTIVEECCRVDLDRRRLDHRVRVTSSRAMRVSRLPIALPITRIDCIRSG
jgi:RNA polymerase sigma-70 factor (ECF subfamily)